MDDYIDPLGDDSDLLEEQSSKAEGGEPGFCSNPAHNHMGIDQDLLPEDIKTLPKLIPFMEMSHLINDIAHKSNVQQEEQEAIIYTLIQVVGKEAFDKNLKAARHNQREAIWAKIADIYDEILNSEMLDEVASAEHEGSMTTVILRTNIETSSDIAKINRDMHKAEFDTAHSDYNKDVITPEYSFREWEVSSQKFMEELKSSIGYIVKIVNKVFSKVNG